MISMKQDCALIVFAKAPQPGYAKTRLARVIGDEAAARLAARMLDETLRQAVASGLGPVELCCAPDDTHSEFQLAVARHDVILSRQGEGDLGVRMRTALERALQNHSCALLIGTDCPRLDSAHLREAANRLRFQSAVFLPATDGGYVLIGLSRPMPELFDGIAWSTANVMQQTLDCLDRLGIASAILPPLNDVDEAEDLVHVPRQWLTKEDLR